MGDIIKAILGVEFSKFCFLGGLLLLLIGIICRRSLTLGSIKLPALDLAGRIVASIVGIALIGVPVVSWVTGTTIGLVNVSKHSSSISTGVMNQISLGLIEKAYAQESERLLQAIKIEEEHIKRINIGTDGLYLYIGDVYLKDPSRLLIFIARQEYTNKFKEGNKIDYNDIRNALKKEDIVNYSKVKEGSETTFEYQGKKYKLKVTRIIWHLFGSDSLRVQIFEE